MDLKKLKDEIPFKWRVQSANAYGASCVAYIDARQVQEVLDENIEAGKWQALYEEHKGNLFCKIGIKIGEEWVWRSDCGTESNVEKQKGEASDAFKRAAVMWGIGRFLYSKKIVKLPVAQKGTDKYNKPKYVPHCNGNFVYDAEEITKLCNDGYTEKAKAPTLPIKKKAFKAGGFENALKAGKQTILTVLDKYELTDEQRKQLTAKLQTAE